MCRIRFCYANSIAAESQLTNFALHAPWAGESFSTRDPGTQGGIIRSIRRRRCAMPRSHPRARQCRHRTPTGFGLVAPLRDRAEEFRHALEERQEGAGGFGRRLDANTTAFGALHTQRLEESGGAVRGGGVRFDRRRGADIRYVVCARGPGWRRAGFDARRQIVGEGSVAGGRVAGRERFVEIALYKVLRNYSRSQPIACAAAPEVARAGAVET